ncbi:MAG: ASPIC/UnbV domain-containing protein [Pyrinomonadaceae bacterium]
MSSSDKRVHFGLGRERAIKELEIRWPSGKTQRIANIAADQILKVKELAK